MIDSYFENHLKNQEKIIGLLEVIAAKPAAKTRASRAKPKAEDKTELTVVGKEAPVETPPATEPVVDTAASLLDEAPAEPVVETPPQMTVEDVKQALMTLLAQGTEAETKARAILGKYGAKKLGDIPKESLNAAYAEIKAASGQ